MRAIASIKIISQFSFCYIILNTIYFLNRGTPLHWGVFVWLIGINILAGIFKNNVLRYSICLLFTPFLIVLVSDSMIKVFLGISMIFSVFYFNRGLDKGGYGHYYDEFRKSAAILLVIIIICSLTGKFQGIMNINSPYIILYGLGSFTILRTLRLMEHAAQSSNLSRINLRYAIAIIISAFGLSIEPVREGIIKAWGFLYESFVYIIILFSKIIFIVIGYGLQYIINKLYILIMSKKPAAVKDNGGVNFGNKYDKNGKYLFDNLSNNKYFHIFVWVIIAAIICMVFVKLFRKSTNRERILEECQEEKEFILEENDAMSYIKKLITHIAVKRNNNEQIRFYYSKFLKLCIDKKLSLKSSDTSLEINQKAKEHFNDSALMTLRQTYIKIRYGKYDGDKETYEEFKKTYKALKTSIHADNIGNNIK